MGIAARRENPPFLFERLLMRPGRCCQPFNPRQFLLLDKGTNGGRIFLGCLKGCEVTEALENLELS